MYFNVKYYSSVVYGSALLGKFILWTQYLEPNLRNVVHKVIATNSYYAHSENVLLTMLFDDRKAVRDRAINRILHYRRMLYDPTQCRVYKKPVINFNCTNYIDMIDINNNSILFEPPFTHKIPYEHLEEFLASDDPPLEDPRIPSHIQGTERHVQLLTSVSRRAVSEKREGILAATIAAREKFPRLDSKKDFHQQ